jgi:uncharacterized protein YgiM (DUF1202 family)
MKTLILPIVISIFSLITDVTFAQTYTTESKNCGKCQKEVSIYSKVGDRCPHCGVVWGKENTHTKYENDYFNSNNFSENQFDNYFKTKTAITNTSCNVRTQPSTSSEILGKVGAFETFDVVEVYKNWIKVKVSVYNSYLGYISEYGYIHKSLVTLI